MTPEQFAYWLQGYFEIREATTKSMAIDDLQAAVIKSHLDLVFVKKTPTITPPKTDPYNIVNPFDYKELVAPTSPLYPNNIAIC